MAGTRRAMLVAVLSVSALVGGSVATAHEEATDDGAKHDNRHALHDFSHEGEGTGHIAKNVNHGLRPVGNLAPAGVQEGHYTDVWAAHGTAYVGSFHEPNCDRSGVYAMDIGDPAAPRLVSTIASPPDSRVNDVKTIDIDNTFFQGTVLIHSIEPCGPLAGGQVGLGQGGIALYDVTDPAQPHALKRKFYDVGVHNTFPWSPDGGETAYLIMVDDVRAQDVVIVDITRPQAPKMIARVGLPDWPAAQDEQSEGMGSFAFSFNHDVWVKEIGASHLAVVSYWDAGFVVLNVDDPANPVFVDDSTYPDPDPVTGFSPPEGNAHAAAFDAVDGDLIFAGDEDFDPFRLVAEITSGPFAGDRFDATQGSDVPQIDEDTSLVGPTVFVSLACDSSAAVPAAPSADSIAVVERGDCTFTEKAGNVQAAGYQGGIVFNHTTGCEEMVSMLVEADIPFLFTRRSAGFAILGIEGYDPSECGGGSDGSNPPLPPVGTSGEDVSISADFDGWGYFHLLDRASLAELGYYAPGEVNDADFATGFGDLTMHNVEGDPTEEERAFVAWYSLGMRVVERADGFSVRPPGDDWDAATPGSDDYYGENVREVGRFIADEGSNFWGVHVTEVGGQQYVLGSDRGTGLWIFQFDPSYCDPCS